MNLFINNSGCCIFNCLVKVTMKDESVRFFLWLVGFAVSLFYKLLIEFLSDILDMF